MVKLIVGEHGHASSLNFDDITVIARPLRDTVFVCCDMEYFKKFSQKLLESYRENVQEFEGLHFHIIGPPEPLKKDICGRDNGRVTYSFEDATNTAHLRTTAFENAAWMSRLPHRLQTMIALEQVRGKRLRSALVSRLIALGVNPQLFIKKRLLRANAHKVYFACRRFMMPSSFFEGVRSVLIVDADSYFNADPCHGFVSSSSAFAVGRTDSWSKFLAGYVFVSLDQKGLEFLDSMKSKLQTRFENGEIYWGVDQVCLDACGDENLLACFPQVDIGFKKGSHASFVSLKGSEKF